MCRTMSLGSLSEKLRTKTDFHDAYTPFDGLLLEPNGVPSLTATALLAEHVTYVTFLGGFEKRRTRDTPYKARI